MTLAAFIMHFMAYPSPSKPPSAETAKAYHQRRATVSILDQVFLKNMKKSKKKMRKKLKVSS